jgi:hypothetical protein
MIISRAVRISKPATWNAGGHPGWPNLGHGSPWRLPDAIDPNVEVEDDSAVRT